MCVCYGIWLLQFYGMYRGDNMRFLYAIIALMLWMLLICSLGIEVDSNTLILCLAIVSAGAMAGGD